MREVFKRSLCYCLHCWIVASIPSHYFTERRLRVNILCPGCRELHADFVMHDESGKETE